jgi:hypothetical protein
MRKVFTWALVVFAAATVGVLAAQSASAKPLRMEQCQTCSN